MVTNHIWSKAEAKIAEWSRTSVLSDGRFCWGTIYLLQNIHMPIKVESALLQWPFRLSGCLVASIRYNVHIVPGKWQWEKQEADSFSFFFLFFSFFLFFLLLLLFLFFFLSVLCLSPSYVFLGTSWMFVNTETREPERKERKDTSREESKRDTTIRQPCFQWTFSSETFGNISSSTWVYLQPSFHFKLPFILTLLVSVMVNKMQTIYIPILCMCVRWVSILLTYCFSCFFSPLLLAKYHLTQL